MKVRKKPVVVDAVKFTVGKGFEEAQAFCPTMVWKDLYEPPHSKHGVRERHGNYVIPTLEGDHIVSEGDYIIKGVHGEFYPCKPDIFHKTYEILYDVDDYEPLDSGDVTVEAGP